MIRQLKLLAVVLGGAITLVATVFSAFASDTRLVRGAPVIAAPGPSGPALAPLAACSTMKASEVAWVTLTEDGDIDEQIDAYASGATAITPVFQYNCVPKKTTIVTVFTFNGDTVLNDKEALKASNSQGLYGYPVSYEDGGPIDEGEWGVEFYNNKTLLTSGTVIVGDEQGGTSDTVTIEGTVTDKKTKKPIRGATILVFVPGVTIQDFIKGGQKDKDVLTGGQTDSKGQFTLESPLERNTKYSIIVVAKKYKTTGADGFVIADKDPDPLVLNITMTK